MVATKKLTRVQIPDQFRDRAAKRSTLAILNQDLSNCEPGTDDFISTTNKIRKAQATPIKRKTGAA